MMRRLCHHTLPVLAPAGIAMLLVTVWVWHSSPVLPKVQAQGASPFVVFDGTLFKNKPNLTALGVRSVAVLYESRFWDSRKVQGDLPDRTLVERMPLELKTGTTGFVIIDIERWPVRGSSSVVDDSLAKYRTILHWLRDGGLVQPLGYYATVPIPDYWRAIKGPGTPDFLDWQKENDRLQPLADEVDALFPSVYTFYADRQGWTTYAIAQIAEARRHAHGKPVYAFLMPYYHESNQLLGGSYLERDYWELELRVVRQHADGLVVWGGWGPNGLEPWNDDAVWWQVLKEFLKTTPPVAPQ